ncbi:MAG TPA: DUF1990 domain-containing protein, partial [Vicinamibacterales bacterium]|nr:DUF1990 domain-containing protein [Vicinamibacterales bacterium]
MFLTSRPPRSAIAQFLERAATMSLSYSPIGIARQKTVPGFRVDETSAVIGRGESDFARALTALEAWEHMRLDWIEVVPDAATIQSGTTVAVLARHLGCWSLNACRVVYTVEESTGVHSTFGFAYGTLHDHVESGEEIFQLSLDHRTGEVLYTIRAASRPHALLVKLAQPLARSLQRRFRRESCDALR